jgi:hypothetical protein
MTNEELAKQDSREMFTQDPREVQELLAEVHAELGDRHPSFSTDEDGLSPADAQALQSHLDAE